MHLAARHLVVNDFVADLSDGVLLGALVEQLSGKSLPIKIKSAKLQVQKVQNVNISLQFMISQGIKLVNIDGADIVEGSVKLILAVIWHLIIRYQLLGEVHSEQSHEKSHSEKKPAGNVNVKDQYLMWARAMLADYPSVHIQNLHDSWQDGVAFCGLIHKLNPSLIDMNEIKKENKAANLHLAFDLAKKAFWYLPTPRC